MPDPSLVQFSGDPSVAQVCLSVYIMPEPKRTPSTSGTGRSVVPDHGRHLILLTPLPDTQGMYLPLGLGENLVTCGAQAAREFGNVSLFCLWEQGARSEV